MIKSSVVKMLEGARTVAIMGHKKGDADCYGSAFALALGLQSLGKQAYVISTEDYPQNLEFLFYYYNGELVTDFVNTPDVFVAVDGSDLGRLVNPVLAKKGLQQPSLIIDHHTAGDLVDMTSESLWDDTASSTAELVYDLLAALGVTPDKNIATLLLTGIIADTSSFQNQNTTKHSLEIASELLAKGARKKTIVSHLFGGSNVDSLKLWGLAMKRLNHNRATGAVSSYLTKQDIANFGISGDAVSGIVNYLNQVKGAKLVILATEEEEGQVKISFRTRDPYVDVAALARHFGGGGHVKAAGVTILGKLVEGEGGVYIQ